MNDYLGIIGLACLDPGFREDLMANGAAVVETRGLPAPNLTAEERQRLDDLKEANREVKAGLNQGFTAVRDGIMAACRYPPCGIFSVD
jgi:hypothetical protein